jgi:hypothetical protein
LGYGLVGSFTLPKKQIRRPISLLKKLFVIILMCYGGRIFLLVSPPLFLGKQLLLSSLYPLCIVDHFLFLMNEESELSRSKKKETSKFGESIFNVAELN